MSKVSTESETQVKVPTGELAAANLQAQIAGRKGAEEKLSELEAQGEVQAGELSTANANLKEQIAGRKGAEEKLSELEAQGEVQVGKLSTANANLQEQIVGRKGAEERLSESEEHYRNVAETATDAIITTDEEGVITFVNRAAEMVFGYASADLFGLKLTMLMPEYLRHVHEASLKTYIATGNRQLEYWEPIKLSGLQNSGKEIPVELSVSRFTKNDRHVFTCIVRDITEREAARESLLRLAAIVESSSEAIIGNALDGTIITWNPGAARMFGYSAKEAIGRHITIVVPGDRADEVPKLLEKIGRGERAPLYETVRLNKDGTQIDVSITVSPIQDSAGTIIGASTIARDIAEQKRAEEKLRESEEHYRNVAETATDAIITTDEDSAITSVNRAAERIFGHGSEELLGRKLTELMPEYLKHVHQASLKTYLTTGDRQLEYWECIELAGLKKGGLEIPVELSVSRFTKNNKHVFTCIVRDITEREVERKSLLRLAAIVESSSEAIIGNTLDGSIITWNRGAEKLFGYSAKEAMGRHLTLVVPSDRANEVPQLLEKIARGDSTALYETVRLNKAGEQIDVSITVSPIQDSAGNIIGASTIARDIAEQKSAEEKLRESEQHYRNVAETATDAIITTDEDSGITFVNRAAERIFGYTSEDLVGQKLTSLMPEYLKHVHQASLKTYITTGDRQLEYWECIELAGLKKGGVEIPVELSVSRFTKNDKHVFTCIVRDITERKQAHESLLRLAAIVESSSDAVMGNTLDGTIFAWNPGAEALFGYSASEAMGQHISLVVPDRRKDEVSQLLERIARSESTQNYETVRLNRQGEEIDVSITVSPIKDGAGGVIGASTIVRDIVEQKKAEEKLRESEEHYRNVAETATDAIITTDEESTITSVNRAAERIFGHISDELLGRKLTELMPEYLRHVHQSSLKTYLTTGDRQLEYWECIDLAGIKKGGEEIPVELSVSRFTKNGQHVFTCIVRDITERKRAQESLLRLAAIVESSSDAIMGNTLDGTIFAWNPGAESQFGYSAREAIGQHISIVVPDRRKDEVSQLLERIARSESTQNYETVRLNREGEEIDVSITVSPIKDGAGGVIGASTIVRDIVEQKKAEEKLRESEEHYRNVAETATDAIITTDEESTIISVNRAAERIFGHISDELLGRKLTELMPEYLRHVHQSSLKTYLTTGDRQLEYWECIDLAGIKKGGEEIPVELSVSRFTKNGQHVFTCIVRDITERKRAQESLLRLAAIVESSRDAIMGNTLDGAIFAWNPGAENLFGYSAREAIGKDLSIVVPADRIHEVPEILERIARAESTENYETVRLNREDKQIDVSITVSPIKDGLGAVIGASTIARDITEQKRAEAQLKALAADLLHSNRELQDFASVASHDLQEPLRKIQTFADDLTENSVTTLSDESRDTLKRIQNAAGRMQRLINDLLSLSRITSRAQPFVQVDLNKVLSEVLTDLEVRISDTGGRVDVSGIPTIEAEPLQMRQLFQNLVGNALKFNKPGRPPIVTVRGELIGGEERLAGTSEAQPQQLCRITFEDNGIGFDEKYCDRIFAMFQRLHGRNEYEGTGMGLAICRRIAERHGGDINARSIPGTGSTFIVTIPTKRTKEEAS